jgi:xylose isomerase
MTNYQTKKEHKFTFGLWTIGNPGRDPFGEPVRAPLAPHEIVKIVGELGGYGVNFHDNDLIPIDASPSDAERILKDFKKALADYDVKVPMATTNLFSDPVFRDGAFTPTTRR